MENKNKLHLKENSGENLNTEFWKILVVDDMPSVHKTTEIALKGFVYEGKLLHLLYATDVSAARQQFELNPDISVVLLDALLPGDLGFVLISYLRNKLKNQIIRIILRTGEPKIAPEITVMGQYEIDDYLLKTEITQERLFSSLTAALRAFSLLKKLENENIELKNNNSIIVTHNKICEDEIKSVKSTLEEKELELKIGKKIIAESPQLKNLIKEVDKIAGVKVNVIITGETGTGKDILAKMIHYKSQRKNKPFLAINCAELEKEKAPSLLFGYGRGVFTGQIPEGKAGYFEAAGGGTLFLDEIGELATEVQAQLLRALDDKKIQRIGTDKIIPVDTLLIAATNRNIDELKRNGIFREDLYQRFSIELNIPPLRERTEDINPMIYYFVERTCIEEGFNIPAIEDSVYTGLINYSFPGNVRELDAIIKKSLIFRNRDEVLEWNDVKRFLKGNVDELPQKITDEGCNLLLAYERIERDFIIRALKKYKGNVVKANEALGFGESRNTLYKLLRKHSINPNDYKN